MSGSSLGFSRAFTLHSLLYYLKAQVAIPSPPKLPLAVSSSLKRIPSAPPVGAPALGVKAGRPLAGSSSYISNSALLQITNLPTDSAANDADEHKAEAGGLLMSGALVRISKSDDHPGDEMPCTISPMDVGRAVSGQSPLGSDRATGEVKPPVSPPVTSSIAFSTLQQFWAAEAKRRLSETGRSGAWQCRN
jgi:hypothetical protein